MHAEECCQALLVRLLPTVDRRRTGLCVDVGVGTSIVYCQTFAKLGFPTAAVEPLVTDEVREALRRCRATLFEGVLSDIDGTRTLYVGSYEGVQNIDLSSLRSDWWGATAREQQVQSVTLPTLLSSVHAKRVTCLKADVEGVELLIIRQLQEISRKLLPAVVMFEYGGGNSRESGQAGWSAEYLDSTMACLSILGELGYSLAVVVEAAPGTAERVIDLRMFSALTPDLIFYPQAIYGNIIAFRRPRFSQKTVAGVCQDYRDSASNPGFAKITTGRLRRLLRHVPGHFVR